MSEHQHKRRLIGEVTGQVAGPTVIVTAGIHGNEASGIQAAERVLSTLNQDRYPLRGRVLAVRGNLGALQAGQRYQDRDLNRAWTAADLDRLRGSPSAADQDETREQRELLDLLGGEIRSARDPVILIDLHSSSSRSSPFVVIGDTIRNRRLAFSVPLPVILGLEESIEGSLIEFLGDLGHTALAVEGGLEGPAAADVLQAVLWLLLEGAGSVLRNDVPDHPARVREATAASRGAPRVVEILHRHGIGPEDEFQMQDGFDSFSPVRRGAILATDRNGDVHAEFSGLVLLPLRQKQGAEGYFLGRKVGLASRALAPLLRAIRLQGMLSVLPGVSLAQNRRDALLVRPDVARWLVRPLFNLLGYRCCRESGSDLVFTRRRPGNLPVLPWPISSREQARAGPPPGGS